jgi:hypothetical protein
MTHKVAFMFLVASTYVFLIALAIHVADLREMMQ